MDKRDHSLNAEKQQIELHIVTFFDAYCNA